MMEANFFNEAASNRVKFQELSSIKQKNLPDNIFVEFGLYNPDAVELEPGKILILDQKETEGLNVVFENRVIHTGKVIGTGKICIADDRFAIRIVECR